MVIILFLLRKDVDLDISLLNLVINLLRGLVMKYFIFFLGELINLRKQLIAYCKWIWARQYIKSSPSSLIYHGCIVEEIPLSFIEYLFDAFGGWIKFFMGDKYFRSVCYFPFFL